MLAAPRRGGAHELEVRGTQAAAAWAASLKWAGESGGLYGTVGSDEDEEQDTKEAEFYAYPRSEVRAGADSLAECLVEGYFDHSGSQHQ